MRISVIGLGKLGLCAAACFAAKESRVIGVDVNAGIVDAVNNGRAPFYEPRLQEMMETAGSRLRATQDYRSALEESDATFLIVPTPSEPTGRFSAWSLREALRHLSSALRGSSKPYHLFNVTSTVSPGTTTEQLIPLVEELSGRKLHDGFGVCYNPEFVALGSVISDFLKPDMVLIGECDDRAGGAVASLYRAVCENTPYVARMSIVSAEIAKISLNAFVTMKISFANTLAAISEAIPGADGDAITRALGADRRIAPHALKGGLPFGGPCFPRDNRAFAAFAECHGVDARLAKATDDVNLARERQIVRLVEQQLSTANEHSVSILGLAYKAGTPVIDESPAVAVVQHFLRRGDVAITVYDRLAAENARSVFGDRVAYATSVRECVSKSALCVIMTPCDEFRSIDERYVAHDPTTFLDCWRILDPSRLGGNARYVTLGTAMSKPLQGALAESGE